MNPTEVGLGAIALAALVGLLRELRERGRAVERMVEVVAKNTEVVGHNSNVVEAATDAIKDLRQAVARMGRASSRSVPVHP
jgi:HAMP domain-containing protein